MPTGDSPVQEEMNRQLEVGANPPQERVSRPGVTPSKFLISSQIIIHDVKTIPRPVATRNSLHRKNGPSGVTPKCCWNRQRFKLLVAEKEKV